MRKLVVLVEEPQGEAIEFSSEGRLGIQDSILYVWKPAGLDVWGSLQLEHTICETVRAMPRKSKTQKHAGSDGGVPDWRCPLRDTRSLNSRTCGFHVVSMCFF